MTDDRRLIEDYLPIQAISKEAAREKSVRKGHISTLHLWWARRPLVAARAAVYGALVPASRFVPPNGSEARSKSLGRANAAKFVERLCKYPGDPSVIAEAQRHILEAHAERLTHETGQQVTPEDIETGRAPRPKVLDMFAGGGSIPLEALRLGCEAHALDLNPVAHIIELCTLVYPQKYGKPDPNAKGSGKDGTWAGLAAEVEYWGKWVLERVRAEVGDLYPLIPDPRFKAQKVAEQAAFWSAGEPRVPPGYLVPVAYLWTRTVRCKNLSCGATVPLARQLWASKNANRYVAMKPQLDRQSMRVRFSIVASENADGLGFDPSTGSSGGNATCAFCGTVADYEYVKSEGREGRLSRQLMATVCQRTGESAKSYVEAGASGVDLREDTLYLNRIDSLCRRAGVDNFTEPLPAAGTLGFRVQPYGFRFWRDVFLPRQRLAILSFCSVVRECRGELKRADYSADAAKVLLTYLAIALNRLAGFCTSQCMWLGVEGERITNIYSRHALPMVWDFAEVNPFNTVFASWASGIRAVSDLLPHLPKHTFGHAYRGSAVSLPFDDDSLTAVVSDPPYYDNVPYADLSDFFYIIMKRTIGDLYPEHFGGQLTPKKGEAIAEPARHGGDRTTAKGAYESMIAQAFREAHRVLGPAGQLVIVYAHKTTLGWATLIDGLKAAGFTITEAWPLDTEKPGRLRAQESAALASSIFLCARKREFAATGSYEDDVRPELDRIVRERVETLWDLGVVGADLIIAAVGAGLRAFTRFERVEYANGEDVPAKRFLAEVEGVVLETMLEKIFGLPRSGVSAVDAPSRFYVLWRYTYGAGELDAGEAIVFTYGQRVELDGPKGLSTGGRAMVEKKKAKYRLRDFSERGRDERLGLPGEDGTPAPLIDVLQRALWLVEYEPRSLSRFLDEARVNREQLRLVAQALAGAGLKGRRDGETRPLVSTTAAEQSALGKLLANWRALIEASALPLYERGGMV